MKQTGSYTVARLVVAILLMYPPVILADQVRFKTGAVISNVVVVDTLQFGDQLITLKGKGYIARFRLIDVEHVLKGEVDLNDEITVLNLEKLPERVTLPTSFFKTEEPFGQQTTAQSPAYIMTYPNLKFIPISILAFALSWDYFERRSDVDDLIESFKRVGVTNLDDLERTKTRYTVIGIVALLAGVANTIFSFQSAVVKVEPGTVTVSYNF